jgi:ABC-type glycerol-3-phosphate transport system permease component
MVSSPWWPCGPFVWLFITSISNQRDLMVRPMPLIPPTLNLDNRTASGLFFAVAW